MKNTIKFFGIIAFVAVIGFSMTACPQEEPLPTTTNPEEQTRITVTGLTSGTTPYTGKYAFAGLDMTGYSNIGFTLPKQITEDSMEFKLIDENKKAISVEGSVTLVLIITETSDPKSTSVFEGYTIDTVKKGSTTIKFSDFTPKS